MDEAALDQLLALLDELAERSRTRCVVVEGPRDVQSLRRLGIGGDVRALHRGTPLFVLCEEVAHQHAEAILLTDWDPKGEQLHESLHQALQACGVRADGAFRARIRDVVRASLKDVESLAGAVDRGLQRHRRMSLEEWREAAETGPGGGKVPLGKRASADGHV